MIIIFFSRCICWKREIKLWEFLCFLSVACFLSSALWLRIKMFCFTLLVLNAKNLPPLDTNGTWYVLLDAVRDSLQRRYFLSAAKIQTSVNIIRFPVYIYIGHLNTILRECPPFFFNFILGSRLTTTPFFVFSYAFLNKTTFGIVLGLSDPYVTLRLLPEDLFGKEVKKTETIKSTLFPLFDEQFDL